MLMFVPSQLAAAPALVAEGRGLHHGSQQDGGASSSASVVAASPQAYRKIFIAALPLLLADVRQRTRRRAVQEGVRSPSTGLERFRQRMAQWHKVRGQHEEMLEGWIEDEEFDQMNWERFMEQRQEELESLAEQGQWDEFARHAASNMEADLLDAAVRIALRHGMVEFAWEEILKRSLRWPSKTDEAWHKLSKGARRKLDRAQALSSRSVAIKALGAHYQPALDAEAQARASSSEEPVEEEKVDSENPLAIAEEVLAATQGKALVDLRFEFAITEANVASRMRTDGRKALFEKVRKDLQSIASTAKKMRVKVRTPDRWNMLVSLMGNSNHLPTVFEVTDLMEKLRVKKDDETMSRLSPAAVREVSFHIAADSFETMPQPELPEIVFVGRSNTGKSSLVNALLGMPALAPVAALPGKTTRFHFYAVNKTSKIKKPLSLVDVPGLGVAVAVKDQMEHWKCTLFQYFQKRGPTLRGVFHLIDSEALVENGCLSPEDEEIMDVVKAENIEYTMVLTKVDIIEYDPRGKQLTRQLTAQLKKRGLGRKGVLPKIVPSSTKTGVGREQLWKRLWSCFDPMNPRWEGQDLETVQSELDELISEGEVDELVARAGNLLGEAWEYALRGLVKLGHCTKVWDLIEERLQAAEEGVGSISFTPAQARVTLVVAEAALRGDAPDLDEAGCERIANKALDFLERGQENATAIEVMLELVVADAERAARALESGGSGYSDSRAKVLAGLAKLVEKSEEWQVRPWSIDRWNRLLASLAGVQDLEYLHRIIDTMRAMRIREGETLHTIIEGATVRCREEVASVSMITDLPPHDLPEVIFVGGGGKCAESPVLGPLLTQQGYDEEAAMCQLSFVNNDDDERSGLRPFALVQVPLPNIPAEQGFMAEEAVSDWSDNFYAYLEQRKKSGTPVHVFHSINAKHFTSLLQGRYRNWSEHALDEAVARAVAAVPEAMVGEQASVTLVDMVVQAAAKRLATSYTAVIADCELLGMDKAAVMLQGKAHRQHAHPRVVARREAALRDEIGAKLAGCEVILANATTCRGATEIWRSLWEALAQIEAPVPSRPDDERPHSSSSTKAMTT